MADHMVDGGANGLGKALVVEWRGYCLLVFHGKFMTDTVQFRCSDTGLDVFFDHFELFGRKPANGTHFIDFFWCVDVDHW